MYIRLKTVNGRRYAYLVEGARTFDGTVSQKTIAYLGAVAKLSASGVPDRIRRRTQLPVNWNRMREQIRRIPLTFDELADVRRAQFAVSMKSRARARRGRRVSRNVPRAEGELAALAKLTESRFKEIFREVGERQYQMR